MMHRATRFLLFRSSPHPREIPVALLRTYLALCALLAYSCAHAATTTDGGATVADIRGPAGRRHNFWWWLALGVSGLLLLLLMLLLALSWCCCARHSSPPQRRCRCRSKQHENRNGGDDGPSDDALATSPDNFTTRHGSHDTNDEAHQRDGAAEAEVVALSNCATTTRKGNHGDHVAGNDATLPPVEARHHERRRIFLIGAGGSKKAKRSSPPRKHSKQPRSHTAPLAASTVAAPAATWTNKPRTRAPASPITPARPIPFVEHFLPVEHEMSDVTEAPNPFSRAGGRYHEVVEVPSPAAVIAVEATDLTAAGTPLDARVNEAAAVEVPAFTQSPSPPQPRNSPERVVDVPSRRVAQPDVGQDPPSLQHERQRERQLLLAKSPMRSSMKSQDVNRTAETAPTAAAITRGSAKQYFFDSQRKPTPTRPSNTCAPTTVTTITTAASSPLRESPHPASVAQQQQQQQQQWRLKSPRRRSPSTPPSLVPSAALSEGRERPSIGTPYRSHVFSPLRLTGFESEAAPPSKDLSSAQRSDLDEAAEVAVAPIVPSDRPPRYQHPSSKPRVPPLDSTHLAHAATAAQQQQQQRQPHQHRYTSTSSATKRIELFRKGSHKVKEPSPSRAKGRSGSAPAVNGRSPLPVTATPPSLLAAPPGYGSDNSRRTSSTVTKGVPQLFFGKREAPPAHTTSAYQRPPRPESTALHRQTRGSSEEGSRKVRTALPLSAVHVAPTSPASLLLSGSALGAGDAAAAALVGGGGGRAGLSRQSSPSHYGSVASSANGGNSPSRTSLGRLRSSSKVRFVDEDGVSGSTAGGEWRRERDGAGTGVSPSSSAAPGPGNGAAATTPTQSSLVSSSFHGSGAALKGRPQVASVATFVAAKKEALPDLPPVAATAQVVVEQGRRTAVQQAQQQQQQPPFTTPATTVATPTSRTAAGGIVEPPPRHTTGLARQPHASVRASPETVTPPFSTATAAPLEAPPVPSLRATPTAATMPPSSATQRQQQPPSLSLSSPQQSRVAEAPVSSRVRSSIPRVRDDVSPVRAGREDSESVHSEASTMPAGMLPSRSQDWQVSSSAAPSPQTSQQQQPLYSTISPYNSTHRMSPTAATAATTTAASTEASYPRHASGIEVLRITRASGDVQLMPPPASSSTAVSQHRREVDEPRVRMNSTSRFASGQAGGSGVGDKRAPALRRASGGDDAYVVVAGDGPADAPPTRTNADPRGGLSAQHAHHRHSHRFGSTKNGSSRHARAD
ncbi:hypothetical protein ABB37_01945 [Leptomonas pyrrhocoris]|uniref:Proteophosphoglycan ppg4 n=1 Tax=Leptomonas pyrrhocoris TaxID=157538 RepID=A0A0M9G736_LEPPY|nr:hypothetical protein ABB37_01945 [Leptomonas pyrrhocoris]KPA83689.1 hypothetical protein ABB37_01945 [Leptomonas pyrrhocoris]|eukprot:XP_015662128.1 hypothetical protein ABB37_01945 [Leptomonas pyrrhocoris]